AVGGGVQRNPLTHPVVRLYGRRAGHLIEIQRRALAEHGDVDGLTGLIGQRSRLRARLLHDNESRRGRAREAQDAETEAVLTAIGVLLDELARLERRDQPEGGGLVDTQFGRDLGDAGPAGVREDLEHAHCPVDRLHGTRFGFCKVVAHTETLVQNAQHNWSAGAPRRSAAHRPSEESPWPMLPLPCPVTFWCSPASTVRGSSMP